MSIMNVAVITKKYPTHDVLHKQLQPYHEFECTWDDDEYVVEINMLDEYKKDYEEEYKENKTTKSFIEWIKDWYEEDGILKKNEEPDKEGAHQFGWLRISGGKVIEAIKRTNPNKKWDYWIVMDENEKFLFNKYTRKWCNSAKKGDLDLDHMIKNNQDIIDKNKKNWDKLNIVYSKIAYPLTCFAYVKDGNWYERGTMEMWGVVTNEMNTEEWYAHFNKIITELNDNDYITMVRCHI